MSISKSQLLSSWPFVLFPGLKLLVHLLTIPGYGIFRDELYYLACSDRLAFGSSRNGNFDVYLKPADALSAAEPLLAGELDEVPRSWSHDGSRLVIQEYNVGTGVDL